MGNVFTTFCRNWRLFMVFQAWETRCRKIMQVGKDFKGASILDATFPVMDLESCFQECKRLIKLKHFKAAIAAIDALVAQLGKLNDQDIIKERERMGLTSQPSTGKLFHPKLISLYDFRLTAYLQLLEYRKAHSDALKMLDLQPYGVKPYIKLGVILSSQGRYLDAYHIYNRGLKAVEQNSNINISKSLLAELQRQKQLVKNKLRRTSSQDTRCSKRPRLTNQVLQEVYHKKSSHDFVSKLPLELLSLIFRQIPMKELLQMTIVCKLWRTKILQLGELFTTFHISRPISTSEFNYFHSFLSRSSRPGYVRHLEVLSINKVANEAYALRSLCSNKVKLAITNLVLRLWELDLLQLIEHLRNAGGKFCGRICLANFSISTVPLIEHHLVRLLPNLSSLLLLFINGHSNLERSKIRIPNQYSLEVAKLNTALEFPKFTNLKRLLLIAKKGQRYFPKRIPLDILFENNCLPSLCELTIVGFDWDLVSSPNSCGRKILTLPSLEMLFLEQNRALYLNHLANYSHIPNLKKLVFREINTIPEPLIHFPDFGQLTNLDLYNSGRPFTDLMTILDVVGFQLKTLNIGGNNITGFSGLNSTDVITDLETFVMAVPHLQSLLMPLVSCTDTNFKHFKNTIKTLQARDEAIFSNLGTLDLSFNEITTYGLLNFLGYKPPQIQRSQKSSHSMSSRVRVRTPVQATEAPLQAPEITKIRLSRVILHGMEGVSKNLIKEIVPNYVQEIVCEPTRDSWFQFGINSYAT